MSVYDYFAKLNNGKDIKLEKFKNKIILVVNTASKCIFTPQYKKLEYLYRKYQYNGLIILSFPCNQFLSQEPKSNEEIKRFCKEEYKISFPIFKKIEVNGENSHPLYRYLKKILQTMTLKMIN